MASVTERNGVWYIKVKDANGRWKRTATTATNKTEAKRLAAELERQFERQRLGLEIGRPIDGGGALEDLLQWWLDTYAKGTPSYSRSKSTIKANFTGTALGAMKVADVKPGTIEVFLQSKAETLGPQSLNHLRRYLLSAYSCAHRAGRFLGANPAASVKRRKVPKRVPDYLRLEEVPRVLEALDPRWRPLFATAIYTGLRKGELLGLLKTDVDLENRLMTVGRSYERSTTKGGHTDVVALNAELVPFLDEAIKSSPCSLVFPALDGTMMRPDVALEDVLRRAMARAGIVTGYKHKCRKQGCSHSELFADSALRRCPTHDVKLWPLPQVRQIRFHDLRHTCGSLLFQAGASPLAVQRILRHADPRTTTGIYGHLTPGFMRDEIDRLQFSPTTTSTAPGEVQQAAANSTSFGPPVVQASSTQKETPENLSDLAETSGASVARSRGLEPLTFGVTGGSGSSPKLTEVSLPERNRAVRAPMTNARSPTVTGFESIHRGVWSTGGPRLKMVAGGADDLLSVAQVAKRLAVHPSTVYGLCDRGELPAVRVSNAIRISRAALETFIGTSRSNHASNKKDQS